MSRPTLRILIVIAVASGCTYAPELGRATQAVLVPDPHIEPYDDWQLHTRATFRDGCYRYGDYHEGTTCFPFGSHGASCGDEVPATVSTGESHTSTLSGTFSPGSYGTSFQLSTSATFTTTASATFTAPDCQYCWAYVCYTMRVEPRELKHGRMGWRSTSPRVSFSSPVIGRFCKDAYRECNGCADGGAPDGGADESVEPFFDGGAGRDAGAPSDAGGADADTCSFDGGPDAG